MSPRRWWVKLGHGSLMLLVTMYCLFPIIGTQAYFLAIKAGQYGPASALSLTLVPVLLGILLVLFRVFDPPRQETA